MIELLTAVPTTPPAPIRPEHEPKWEELHPNTAYVIRRSGDGQEISYLRSEPGKIIFIGSSIVQDATPPGVIIAWPDGVTEAHVVLDSIAELPTRSVQISGAASGNDLITEIYWNSEIKHQSRSFQVVKNLVRVNSVGDIGQVSAKCMFYKCTKFNQDLSNLNVESVTDMSYMFYEAWKYNQPMATWKTGNVTDMSYMLWNCGDFNQDLSMLDVGNVILRSNYDENAVKWIAAYKPKFK